MVRRRGGRKGKRRGWGGDVGLRNGKSASPEQRRGVVDGAYRVRF